MVDASQMTPALEDKEVGAAFGNSGDNEVQPAITSAGLKSSLTNSQLQYQYVMDSEEDSYYSTSSESSENARHIAGTGTTVRETHDQDSSSDDDSDGEDSSLDADKSGHKKNPISFDGEISVKEDEIGKHIANLQQQEESAEILRDDECDDEGNYVVNEKSRLMEAAQAASIPSDDSFNDDSDYVSPPARIISTLPQNAKSRSATSTKAVPTISEILQNSDDLDSSDEGTSCSLLSEGSSTESSIGEDDDSDEVSQHQQAMNARMNLQRLDHRRPFTKYGIAREEDINPDDDLDLLEHSGHSDRDKRKKAIEKNISSASARFATSSTFKWPSFKTKIFHSFRALKASASSNGDGSRIISVKYLAREVTEDILSEFFHDAGSILDIRITRDEQPGRSGLGSAYVEFKTGAAARKAVQKSGKNLGGRVISCDIAYESSRASRSVPGSGHGKRQQSGCSRSDVDSVSLAERNQSALGFFHPDLQDGDAKFLSRFNEQFNVNSIDDISPPPVGYRDDVISPALNLARGHEHGRNKGISMGRAAAWFDSYGNSLSRTAGKTQGELDLSEYFDAEDLEMEQLSKGGSKSCTAWPWRRWRRKGKRTGIFWVWRRPQWQMWHFAKHSISTKWTRRKSSNSNRPEIVHTRKKITQSGEPVRVRC